MSTNCIVGGLEGLDYSEDKTNLSVGDSLIMYTDGVNEAFNPAFEEFGNARMEASMQQQYGKDCRGQIDGLFADVKAFAADAPQSDDITIMAIQRKG